MNRLRSLYQGSLVCSRVLAMTGLVIACNAARDDSAEAVGVNASAVVGTSWIECATEHGYCSFSGSKTVRYGTESVNVTRTRSDGVACSNDVFGDPVPGTLKKCWYAVTTSETATTWTRCATEWGACQFSGTRRVRYGTETVNVVQTKTNGTPCTNDVFGDPVPGTLKSCWYESEGSSPAPSPSPSPAPAPAPAPSPSPSPSVAGPRVSSFSASGPITASAGQTIAGVRISNPGGPCITIPSGATGVVVRDSDIGPCGGNANIFVEGANATIEHTFVHHGNRGVMAHRVSGTVTRLSRFDTFYGPKFNGTAIEYDYTNGGTVDRNVVRGSSYASDAVSAFESSGMRMIDNDIDIDVAEPSAAAFTMGDATGGNPGSNNYVAGNVVRQRGGVPAGVFGSSGNTILEKNCLTAGIQAYNYSGVFVGVTVRNNVINFGASFVPDKSVIEGWSTNIDSTDCSRVPR